MFDRALNTPVLVEGWVVEFTVITHPGVPSDRTVSPYAVFTQWELVVPP